MSKVVFKSLFGGCLGAGCLGHLVFSFRKLAKGRVLARDSLQSGFLSFGVCHGTAVFESLLACMNFVRWKVLIILLRPGAQHYTT